MRMPSVKNEEGFEVGEIVYFIYNHKILRGRILRTTKHRVNIVVLKDNQQRLGDFLEGYTVIKETYRGVRKAKDDQQDT